MRGCYAEHDASTHLHHTRLLIENREFGAPSPAKYAIVPFGAVLYRLDVGRVGNHPDNSPANTPAKWMD
jgi:hypothetical protein